MRLTIICAIVLGTFALSAIAQEPTQLMNLLKNPTFEFHAFANHRDGKAVSFESNSVAFWSTDAWGDIIVRREGHVARDIRPAFSTRNMVSIAPGKRLWQFFTLPEAGLAPGEHISLHVYAHQAAANALRASIKLLKIDSEDGEWSPKDFGCSDERTFARHARGELVVAQAYQAQSEQTGAVELTIDNAEIISRFTDDKQSHTTDVNTIGIQVEFENTAEAGEVWVYWPTLCRSPQAVARLSSMRRMEPIYSHIPRTIQKLWKGTPIHILTMGSSIDRGSANPPPYLYDEDPASPTFKQPLTDNDCDTALVGRPELNDYYAWWRHYFCYTGRLKRELMTKFDMPASKLLLNIMACDGSCVGEAISGLDAYCSLSIPTDPGLNGHKAGKTWQELYPALFERPGGTGPDLVIFGSGANEKTDTPDEVALYEATIRHIQRRYPDCEFLFCMWQNAGGYTPNPGDLQALALRYQIPMVDFGKVLDEATAWVSKPMEFKDGHPQASGHYLWFKQLETAFECFDPIATGRAQRHLPERVIPTTYGWEGDHVTFEAGNPRIRGSRFIFEDTAINCWGQADGDGPEPYVNGQKLSARRSSPRRDIRNSYFRHGRTRLGDRHILELGGEDAALTAVDAFVCPNRRFLGVGNPAWSLGGAEVSDFASEWGEPYGDRQAVIPAGASVRIDIIGTDISVAYVDAADGGSLRVLVDGVEKLLQPTNVPFTDIAGAQHFMENRKGIRELGYGWHTVVVEAVDGPVRLLGLFTYDSRPNLANERRLTGFASAGETVSFSQAFRVRPLVICHGGLSATADAVTPSQVTFSGEGAGTFEVVGE